MIRCSRTFRNEVVAAVIAVAALTGCTGKDKTAATNLAAYSDAPQESDPNVMVPPAATPANLDFESGATSNAFPASWGGGGHGFAFAVDTWTVHSGKGSLRMRWAKAATPGGADWATATQCVNVDAWKGKRVRLSGFVKTDHADSGDGTGIWLRVDSPKGSTGFDNMRDRRIKGTTDWRQYSDVLDVPEIATDACFGVLQSGNGTVWADDLTLNIVGSDVATTGVKRFAGTAANLDLESGKGLPTGWGIAGGGARLYEVVRDTVVRHGGTSSAHLRMRDGAPAPSGKDDFRYGNFMQAFDGTPWRGKRVSVSAWIKTDGVTGRGDWWARVQADSSPGDGPGLAGGGRKLRATADWTKYELVFDVPAGGSGIEFGAGIDGPGSLWIDDVKFVEVDKRTPLTKNR